MKSSVTPSDWAVSLSLTALALPDSSITHTSLHSGGMYSLHRHQAGSHCCHLFKPACRASCCTTPTAVGKQPCTGTMVVVRILTLSACTRQSTRLTSVTAVEGTQRVAAVAMRMRMAALSPCHLQQPMQRRAKNRRRNCDPARSYLKYTTVQLDPSPMSDSLCTYMSRTDV
jgi:hypothetical protein